MLLDESYNKISKKGQMDLHIGFWDDTDNEVKTYRNSEFLGIKLQLMMFFLSLIIV